MPFPTPPFSRRESEVYADVMCTRLAVCDRREAPPDPRLLFQIARPWPSQSRQSVLRGSPLGRRRRSGELARTMSPVTINNLVAQEVQVVASRVSSWPRLYGEADGCETCSGHVQFPPARPPMETVWLACEMNEVMVVFQDPCMS